MNRLVTVKTSEGDVKGVLRHYQLSDKKTHRPFLLILEDEGVKIIVKTWHTIACMQDDKDRRCPYCNRLIAGEAILKEYIKRRRMTSS